jgi:hypothetical protein
MGEARASRGRPEASERAEADLQALRFGASAREVLREAWASAGALLLGVRVGARGPPAVVCTERCREARFKRLHPESYARREAAKIERRRERRRSPS